MKRILSLLIAMVMTLGCVGITALAEETAPIVVTFTDGYTMNFDSLSQAMRTGYSGGHQFGENAVVAADATSSISDKNGNIEVASPVTYVAKIGDKYYTSFESAVADIKQDGSDTTIKILTDIETSESIEFKYDTGDVIFTADHPVTVKQTSLAKDWAMVDAKDTKFVIDKNVTFEIYDNESGMYLYHGPSIEIKGSVIGGQNWGTLYLFKGDHKVTETGKIGVGRIQTANNTLEVKGKIDTNYLLVENATFVSNGAKIDAGVIYDNNNGEQRRGASKFVIKNSSKVTTDKLTLSYADSELAIDASSSLAATEIVGEGKIIIDATGMTAGVVSTISGNASRFTGTIEVINNDSLEAKIEDGKIVLVAKPVAAIGEKKYSTLQEALADAKEGDTITLLENIELTETVTVPAGKTVALDLNGKTVSGNANSGEDSLLFVSNTAKLTVKDSGTGGKLTIAPGTSNVGYVVDLEGKLILESGTIEMTGEWSIGYGVDVRPNAWGTPYTEETTFTMNGGKIVSSDGAVRVASSSADSYNNIVASFTMNGGEIDADWDGVFVQQSNAAWDVLKVTINGGTIKSDLNPIRFYGPAATSYVNGEDCVNIALNGGTLTYTGEKAQEWLVDKILRLGGGVTVDQFLKDSTVTASASFAEANVAEGYVWVESNGSYTLEKAPEVEEQLSGLYVLRNTTAIAREGYKVPYYRVRAYAAIDSLNYKEVGFEYRIAGSESYSTSTTSKVYTSRKVTNTTTGEVKILTPDYIAPDFGNYIFAINVWANSKNISADTNLEIRPYAKRKDGTTMYLSDWKLIQGLTKTN